METKHTPGPWRVGRTATGKLMVLPVRSLKGIACFTDSDALVKGEWTQRDYPNAKANALLIAAAPETAAERDRLREQNKVLLEALKICAQIAAANVSDQQREITDAIYLRCISAITQCEGDSK